MKSATLDDLYEDDDEELGEGDDDIIAPSRKRRGLTRIRILCAAIAAAAIFVAVLHHAGGIAPPPAEPAAIEQPAWVDVERPDRVFSLSGAFAPLNVDYRVRREARGNGREDILTAGAFDGRSPYLRLVVQRGGPDAPPGTTLYVDLVRRAAETDLAVIRAAQPLLLDTRFGRVEAERVTAAGTAGEASCLGFRLGSAALRMQIVGIACGGANPLEEAQLACIIDGLDLAGDGAPRELREFFAEAEQQRSAGCTASRQKAALVILPDAEPAAAAEPRRRAAKKHAGAG